MSAGRHLGRVVHDVRLRDRLLHVGSGGRSGSHVRVLHFLVVLRLDGLLKDLRAQDAAKTEHSKGPQVKPYPPMPYAHTPRSLLRTFCSEAPSVAASLLTGVRMAPLLLSTRMACMVGPQLQRQLQLQLEGGFFERRLDPRRTRHKSAKCFDFCAVERKILAAVWSAPTI